MNNEFVTFLAALAAHRNEADRLYTWGTALQRQLAAQTQVPKPDELVIDLPSLSTSQETITLTEHQQQAWDKLRAWVPTSKPFFTLRGVAGSGKSFILKLVSTLDANLQFSAPTNKATKVLSDFLLYQCKTTYSLLGLRMTEDEETRILSSMKEVPNLGLRPIVVIDEAGMVPKFMVDLFVELATTKGWRFIFVGDPYQLNPIGESKSAVWKLTAHDPSCRAMMTQVKRFDNQLLALSIRIRECIKNRDFSESPIESDHDEHGGVYVTSRLKFLQKIKKYDRDFWVNSKVSCWRNKTVNAYNNAIREALGFKEKFEPGDLVLAGSPVADPHNGSILAYTDEEMRVLKVTSTSRVFDGVEIVADSLTLADRGFQIIVPRDVDRYSAILTARAADARKAAPAERKGKWASYWELRNAFHDVRYGYALTSHRLQGSTVDTAFIDQADVLANPDKMEAFRSLYVLATRPTRKLIAF